MKEYKKYIAALANNDMAQYVIHVDQDVISFLELELYAKTIAYQKRYMLFYLITEELHMSLN